MAEARSGFPFPLCAVYWAVNSSIACRPSGVASNARNSFSLIWSVFGRVIGHPRRNGSGGKGDMSLREFTGDALQHDPGAPPVVLRQGPAGGGGDLVVQPEQGVAVSRAEVLD